MWGNWGKYYKPSKHFEELLLHKEDKTSLLAGGENSLVCWNISHGYFLHFPRGTLL